MKGRAASDERRSDKTCNSKKRSGKINPREARSEIAGRPAGVTEPFRFQRHRHHLRIANPVRDQDADNRNVVPDFFERIVRIKINPARFLCRDYRLKILVEERDEAES